MGLVSTWMGDRLGTPDAVGFLYIIRLPGITEAGEQQQQQQQQQKKGFFQLLSAFITYALKLDASSIVTFQ